MLDKIEKRSESNISLSSTDNFACGRGTFTRRRGDAGFPIRISSTTLRDVEIPKTMEHFVAHVADNMKPRVFLRDAGSEFKNRRELYGIQ